MSGRRSAAGVVVASVLALVLTACADGSDTPTADTAGEGITSPTELPSFVHRPSTGERPDLPKRLGFVVDNNREFSLDIQEGLEAAAEDRGWEFEVATSGGDPAKNVEQMSQFLTSGVGALFVGPVDPAAQAPVMKEAIDQGVAMMAMVFGPATLQVNAPQYEGGQLLGEAAADHIRENLAGEANVVILNQDSVEPVRPRFEAIRDAIDAVPGATVVADVEPKTTDSDGGFEAMNTILQQHPDIDVVLGADSVALGALAALEAAGKDSPEQFIGGVDGEGEALAKIATGKSPYKASVAQPGGPFAYALGQYAADWEEGMTIPQAIAIAPVLLTSEEQIEAYEAETTDLEAFWSDQGLRDKYLRAYGAVSYETRGSYLAYSWTTP